MESIKEINSNTREAYNKIAGKYFTLFKYEMNEKEFDRNLLDDFAKNFDDNALICDAGCGPAAHIGKYLFDKGLHIIGTDISEECIKIAGEQNPGMELIRKDFFEWDFPESHFDAIISFYSIMYTPRIYINDLLKIFHKSLKQDGKLLLVVKEGITEGYENAILDIKTKIYTSYFTEHEIKNYLSCNGFRITCFYCRNPLNTEINIKRIYAIAEKII